MKIRIFVDVAAPLSPPTALVGVENGTSLALSIRRVAARRPIQ
jgi:hypothetical protein